MIIGATQITKLLEMSLSKLKKAKHSFHEFIMRQYAKVEKAAKRNLKQAV